MTTGNLTGAARSGAGCRDDSPTKPFHPLSLTFCARQGNPWTRELASLWSCAFERDFSRVRVHTNIRANRSARALNALAYTVGRHLVFDTGNYAPETTAGRKLLAHELTHVIQQDQATGVDLSNLSLGPIDDIYELQANSIGEAIAASELVRFNSNSVKQTVNTVQTLLSSILQTETPSIRRQPPPGVCGPDVTAQVASIWAKIQTDFHSWTPSQREEACTRVLGNQ